MERAGRHRSVTAGSLNWYCRELTGLNHKFASGTVHAGQPDGHRNFLRLECRVQIDLNHVPLHRYPRILRQGIGQHAQQHAAQLAGW